MSVAVMRTVITSIPAETERYTKEGADVETQYRRQCTASWIGAGYRIISVNSADDIDRLSSAFPSVNFRVAPDVTILPDGRKLVHVTSLLAQMADVADLCGIIRPDLFLKNPAVLAAFLDGHAENDVSFGLRFDISDLAMPEEGEPNCWDLDYFFFKSPPLANLAGPPFLFGETRWDYWLPTALAQSGYRLRPARVFPVAHLRVDPRRDVPGYRDDDADSMSELWHWLCDNRPFSRKEKWAIQASQVFCALLDQYGNQPNGDAFANLSVMMVLYLHNDSDLARVWSAIISDYRVGGLPLSRLLEARLVALRTNPSREKKTENFAGSGWLRNAALKILSFRSKSSQHSNPPADELDMAELRGLLSKKDPVIIEIGANDGMHTTQFLNAFPQGFIYAFEPDERARARFQIRVGAEKRVRLVASAVGASDGHMLFYKSTGTPADAMWASKMPEGWDMSGSIRPPKNHLAFHRWCKFLPGVEVPITRLDTWAGTHVQGIIDFIWADVQGAEGDLIEGAKNTLARTRFLYTEFSNCELYAGQITLQGILDALPTYELVHRYGDEFGGDVLLRNNNVNV